MDFLELLRSNQPFLLLIAGLLGLLVGSFLNVVIYRLPVIMQRDWEKQAREVLELAQDGDTRPFNLLWPPSCCPHCSTAIRAWQNIPVISWLLLRGRCASCKERISMRYPLVELAAGLLAVLVAWQFGYSGQGAAMLVLTWGLLALSLIDADHQLLPDVLVLPLLWLGLLLNSFELFVSLPDAVYGAAFGYLSLWSVFWLFKLITGKEGMGYGDFKLLAMLGAWGGWQVLPLTILLSSVVGAVLGVIVLRLQRQGLAQPLPFGPYLAIAGWIAIIWGEKITRSYLQFAGF